MNHKILIAVSLLTATAVTPREDRGPSWTLPKAVVSADYYENGTPSKAKVELGRLLYFDKLLSGNRNISCSTCHHPLHASADGVALPLGEGPTGLGSTRRTGTSKAESVHGRVPRNSPALFNLGAREFTRMFHDGRVEEDTNRYYASGFITPARWKLLEGLDNVLAAQAMFPVISATEMAGQKGENPVANAASLNRAASSDGAWDLLARRLAEIPEYVELFRRAYPHEVAEPKDVTYVRAANAIAAFEASAFRADDSPFDHYLRGDRDALDEHARRGMALFYGPAQCSSCHAGAFQTDHDFHAIAIPQIGPGKGDGRHADYWSASGHEAFIEDFGRGRVTMRPEDVFRFRTPSLRNVMLTGPWGHDGVYRSLEEVVRHHLDPVASLEQYAAAAVELLPLGQVLEVTVLGSTLAQSWLSANRLEGFLRRDTYVLRHSELRGRIAAANELQPIPLDEDAVKDLVAFLQALTDPSSIDLSHLAPDRVPSGLPVQD
jgi:cytochrome c peroxidase